MHTYNVYTCIVYTYLYKYNSKRQTLTNEEACSSKHIFTEPSFNTYFFITEIKLGKSNLN